MDKVLLIFRILKMLPSILKMQFITALVICKKRSQAIALVRKSNYHFVLKQILCSFRHKYGFWPFNMLAPCVNRFN